MTVSLLLAVILTCGARDLMTLTLYVFGITLSTCDCIFVVVIFRFAMAVILTFGARDLMTLTLYVFVTISSTCDCIFVVGCDTDMLGKEPYDYDTLCIWYHIEYL